VKLRKRWIDGSETSKPEPFLHKSQKRFGTPASFNRAWVYSGAAQKDWPPAPSVTDSLLTITAGGLVRR
jgi:hypothetical protein